jgi:hypothetical protein
MDHNDELTIAARTKEWEIFAPDWEHFRQLPALPLGALCALSVGLTPYFASPDWVLYTALPHFDGSDPDECFDSGLDDAHINSFRAELLRAFVQRAYCATGNLAPLGHLSIAAGDAAGLDTLVSVSDFIAWAGVRSPAWEMPAEFMAFAESPLTAPAANGPIAKPLSRQRSQEAGILRVIEELGYSAKALPKQPPGMPGPKAAVRARLNLSIPSRQQWSTTVFNKAWERLRTTGEIADAP